MEFSMDELNYIYVGLSLLCDRLIDLGISDHDVRTLKKKVVYLIELEED